MEIDPQFLIFTMNYIYLYMTPFIYSAMHWLRVKYYETL
jgi:hypothetical protein